MRVRTASVLALGAVLLLGQSAAAEPPEKRAPLLEEKVLGLEAARRMVAAAIAEAERNRWRGVVAVVDDGGWLYCSAHGPRRYASVELAAGKARARLFEKGSEQARGSRRRSLRGHHGAGLHRNARGPSGGDRWRSLRAIGASFATTAQDVQVARAGLAALGQ